jgi:hypothetical protein
MGRADALVADAEAALQHAEAAQKAKNDPKTIEGIGLLRSAISQGKQKNADVATRYAEEALTRLEAATK